MDSPIERLMVNIFERTGGISRWDPQNKMYRQMHSLYGASALAQTQRFYAKLFLHGTALLLMGLVMLLATGDAAVFFSFAALAGIWTVYPYRKVSKQLHIRNRDVMLELPVFINRWLLRIGAGESLPNAIRYTSATGKLDHPLYAEFNRMLARIDNGKPFPAAMEELSCRIGVPELTRLIHLLLLHYRKGSDDLFHELRAMMGQLWETRKQTVRKLGEEASAKMVFPMVLIFFALMLLVASPVLFFTT